jgi:predicted flap endonuclease-1-like 5' DNA nuclease
VPPPDAEPDDLRRIRGIGPAMERLLNAEGITTFRQLAVLDDAGIDELQARLPGVPGRIRRDRWVEQAQKLHVETHGDPV